MLAFFKKLFDKKPKELPKSHGTLAIEQYDAYWAFTRILEQQANAHAQEAAEIDMHKNPVAYFSLRGKELGLRQAAADLAKLNLKLEFADSKQ